MPCSKIILSRQKIQILAVWFTTQLSQPLRQLVKSFGFLDIYGMCPLWNVPFSECAVIGMCLFLEFTSSRMWPFWNVLFLECAVFGMCPFRNVLFLECALFGMCPLWNMVKVECDLFGMCCFWNVLLWEFSLFGMCPVCLIQ